MPYTPPTAAEFVARFPAFSGVETDVVDTALTEAASHADDTWLLEADFRLARMLMAAHVLSTDGHGTSIEAELARAGQFTLYRSGSLTLERRGEAAAGWLDQTSYGRRYLALRRRSVPAVAVVC